MQVRVQDKWDNYMINRTSQIKESAGFFGDILQICCM